ncbi:MAG: hypothetical protein KDK70_05645 [Myxococcales bacterium]|nr:hypothetical protein [Myxococcales bacterium]
MIKLDITTRLLLVAGLGLSAAACDTEDDGRPGLEDLDDDERLSGSALVDRANAIKAAHAGHAVIFNPVIFAGIAGAETGLAHCYAEYAWGGCPGQFTSPDCGGGVILAGGADGTCEQGGLGMYQFDEGTQTQTRNHWLYQGKWPPQAPVTRDVVSLSGNVQASIDFVLYKAWISSYTPAFADYQAMYDWINGIRPINGDPNFELWLGFLAHNYNGWSWGTAGWANAKEKYRSNTLSLYGDLGGEAFWYGDGGGPPPGGGGNPPPAACAPEGGTWCGGNGVDGDPSILYQCKGGALVVEEVCASGCYAAPSGEPDACNQPNAANDTCSCANGKYHNGDDIPAESTYCGMRVCGMDGNVYECRSSNAWEQTGLTCGSGACSCPNGAHLDGTPIPTQHTECHVEVCGGGNTWYTCESGGWQAVSGSYCTMGGGGAPPPPAGSSCVGSCGGNAGSCWCDGLCAQYGDCCADKVAACG